MTGPQTSPERPDGADAVTAIESPGCPPGSRFSLLPGVRSRMVPTPRLLQHIYESGPADGEPLLLIHGNASSARWFEDVMAALPEYHVLAPDLRGFGASELKRADASRGMRDYADDIEALVQMLGWDRFHLLGWSLGGCIVMQYVLDHPERVRTLTLLSTSSPYGYGGTRGADGQPIDGDFAGSGAGAVAQQVVERALAKDFTADSPFTARSALRLTVTKPGFLLPPEREDAMVEQMLMMAIGDEYYPGDQGPASPNWPSFTPGIYGPNNALSPKYCDLSRLGDLRSGPPILWIRGADDVVVSDAGGPGGLGKLGLIPGWPGDDIFPPQPMIAQTRVVLDRYAATGGTYQEIVFENCGHAPPWEKPDEFLAQLRAFTGGAHGAQTPDNATIPASSRAGEQGTPFVANSSPAASNEERDVVESRVSAPAVHDNSRVRTPPLVGEAFGGEIPPRRRGLFARLFGRR